MAEPTGHIIDEFTERDGWIHAICACEWETPPCPGSEEAANFWGQHLLDAVIGEVKDELGDWGYLNSPEDDR